jgi:hypothetical protein
VFARREVALKILSSSSCQKETDCADDRNLTVHAELVTAPCEAAGNLIRSLGSGDLVRRAVVCQRQGGSGARLGSMVSRSELLINVVTVSKPKALLGLSPKGKQSDFSFNARDTRTT